MPILGENFTNAALKCDELIEYHHSHHPMSKYVISEIRSFGKCFKAIYVEPFISRLISVTENDYENVIGYFKELVLTSIPILESIERLNFNEARRLFLLSL